MARRRGLTSNADAQKAWEKRTREAQIARQRATGQRTPPKRAMGTGGRTVLPPEPKPVPGPAVVYPASAGTDEERRKPKRPKRGGSNDTPAPIKREVHRRAAEKCEANWPGVCPTDAVTGMPLPHRGEHVHHVILRSQGGPDEVWNLLLVCHVVHTHAHDVDRAGAEARGIIRRPPPPPTVEG